MGALFGMGIAGATVLASKRLPRPQVLAAANLAALTFHQYEEYEDPGYFPGQFNRGVLHSDEPDRYPLNTNTAMIVDTALAYPFYGLPIIQPTLLPKHRWLGIAPVLFGFLQAVGHGTIFPRLAHAKYSPGFLASLLLHVPIGIAYMRAIHAQEPLQRSDLAKAMAYNVAFAVTSIAGPNVLLKDKNSPYVLPSSRLGPTRLYLWTPRRSGTRRSGASDEHQKCVGPRPHFRSRKEARANPVALALRVPLGHKATLGSSSASSTGSVVLAPDTLAARSRPAACAPARRALR